MLDEWVVPRLSRETRGPEIVSEEGWEVVLSSGFFSDMTWMSV